MIYRIPKCNLERLTHRIDKLTRKAVKLRQEPPALVIDGNEDVMLIRNDKGTRQEWEGGEPLPVGWEKIGYRRYINCHVVGKAPVIEGWKLLAVVEHGDSEVGNVVRTVPGEVCPSGYRVSLGWCDHCKTTRRRLETFILRNTENDLAIQVGRNCLADFCRSPERAEQLAREAEWLQAIAGWCEEAESWGPDGKGPELRHDTTDVLALTARIIRGFGWMSRSKAKDDPYGPSATADIVSNVLYWPQFLREHPHIEQAANDVQPQDTKLAEDAIEWVRGFRTGQDMETLSDYEHNLLVVLTGETLERRHLGIACSAIASYEGWKHRKEESARQSRHVGTVGKRETFTVKVKQIKAFAEQSNYSYGTGVRLMIRMEDPDGNALIWWTSPPGGGLEEGDAAYKILATVKAHTDYKGRPQTVLTRVKRA